MTKTISQVKETICLITSHNPKRTRLQCRLSKDKSMRIEEINKVKRKFARPSVERDELQEINTLLAEVYCVTRHSN